MSPTVSLNLGMLFLLQFCVNSFHELEVTHLRRFGRSNVTVFWAGGRRRGLKQLVVVM